MKYLIGLLLVLALVFFLWKKNSDKKKELEKKKNETQEKPEEKPHAEHKDSDKKPASHSHTSAHAKPGDSVKVARLIAWVKSSKTDSKESVEKFIAAVHKMNAIEIEDLYLFVFDYLVHNKPLPKGELRDSMNKISSKYQIFD